MTDIRIVRDYPHPPAKVWRALTDPALIALWAMRPEGFAAVVGNRSRFVAKPQRGWRGFVECEVLEVRERELLRYSWIGNEGEDARRPLLAELDAEGALRPGSALSVRFPATPANGGT